MGRAVRGLFDDFTPRAVWLEYGARKRQLADSVVREEDYERLVEKLADELGCGVPPSRLTPEQRAAQASAGRKWGGR